MGRNGLLEELRRRARYSRDAFFLALFALAVAIAALCVALVR